MPSELLKLQKSVKFEIKSENCDTMFQMKFQMYELNSDYTIVTELNVLVQLLSFNFCNIKYLPLLVSTLQTTDKKRQAKNVRAQINANTFH